MDIALLLKVFAWAAVINYAVLIVWLLLFTFARSFIYKMHSLWFNIADEKFDAIHYSLMGGYKLLVMVLFLTPYIALRIVT